MTAPQMPSPGVSSSHGVSGVGAAGRSARAASSSDGAAFRALLDQLEDRAGALAEKSRGALDPGELSEVVDEAHASLQDALQLSSELLEAWRQARHQAGQKP